MKKINYYRQIISTLQSLNKSCPSCNMGKHIATAVDGEDLWGMTDKEFLKVLKDYQFESESDVFNGDIEEIIKQGLNLNNILEEEEEN